ncbi:EamA family transporter [Kitasatospora mediocidica]|uniref:EamA family transporter n=1 Tax=Kitasatospora mediocidica TaxID=58352 RepID=UPI0007C6D006|nr:EamA family transporter [Kitasatospora mediocidica]
MTTLTTARPRSLNFGTYGAAGLAVAAMVSVQSGAAVSTWMFPTIGPAATASLRLAFAAVMLLVWARPRLRGRSRTDLLFAAALGMVSAVMTLCYFQAIDRIPLGVASSLEFLGPLAVAVAGLRRRADVIWPVLALSGVLILTQPWNSSLNLVGLAFGTAAGAALGGYVVFTQRVGDRFSGVDGLAISVTVAALCAAPLGLPHALSALTPKILLGAAAAAVLLPVLPYVLEMVALRKLTTAAFGTLLSFEPAVATLIGFVLLHQHLTIAQMFGIACVMSASLAAVRRGGRPQEPSTDEAAPASS